jgi:CubicO group peptidase (beta-lactamase class C family)
MTMADRVDAVLRAGEAPNLHGLVVSRQGQVVLERYGEGADYRLGDSLGRIRFDAGTLHDMRSISKSVVALLYGIALKDGLVPEPGEGLVRQFPEYPDLVADPARAHLTIEHALTMTLGLEWDESVPYTSVANSELAMEASPDRYRYVLERPIVEEAGKRWSYCGGSHRAHRRDHREGRRGAAGGVRAGRPVRAARDRRVRVDRRGRRRGDGGGGPAAQAA